MIVICPHCFGDVVVVLTTKDCTSVSTDSNARSNELNVRSNDNKTSVDANKTHVKPPSWGEGGVSGSGPVLDLPSDPSQQSGSGRAIRRGRKDQEEYPVAFLGLWALAKAQGKAGNKFPAFKSWSRLNASTELNALILTRFGEWMETDAWKRGYNQHLATWLNQRGWEEPPTAKDLVGPDASIARPGANGSATGPSPKRSDYCIDHVDARNKLWSSMPRSTCPECKYQRARHPTHPRVVSMEALFAKESA